MVDENLNYQFKNNAVSTLAAAITTTSQTSIEVAAGEGALFPSLVGDGTNFFLITCVKSDGTKEIMCVVARSTDTMTIGVPGSGSANASGRGYESTTKTTFSIDDVCAMYLTAGICDDLRDRPGVHTWTSSQRATMQTLSDGASIAWNMDSGNDAKVTLGGDRTLANPTNQTVGQGGYLYVVQDSTGSRTLSWNAAFLFKDGTAPVLATAANAIDLFSYHVYAANSIMVSHHGSMS